MGLNYYVLNVKNLQILFPDSVVRQSPLAECTRL